MLAVRLISRNKHGRRSCSQVLSMNVNKTKQSLSVATASQTQGVVKMCAQPRPCRHEQNHFSNNNNTTTMPKKKTDGEIQTICNSEIHNS